MSSFALDHHVAHTRTRNQPAGEWSPRRRLTALTVCIAAAWAVVLTPVLLWL